MSQWRVVEPFLPPPPPRCPSWTLCWRFPVRQSAGKPLKIPTSIIERPPAKEQDALADANLSQPLLGEHQIRVVGGEVIRGATSKLGARQSEPGSLSRALYGAGSVYRRNSDGRWC